VLVTRAQRAIWLHKLHKITLTSYTRIYSFVVDMNKKGGIGIVVLVVVVIVGLGVGGYFMFFGGCPEGELFNPYQDICVSKSVFCNLDSECTLLEGQVASIPGETLTFELVFAEEAGQQGDSAIILVGGREVTLSNYGESYFSFGDYTIVFESSDGDADKIMGATFEVTKV